MGSSPPPPKARRRSIRSRKGRQAAAVLPSAPRPRGELLTPEELGALLGRAAPPPPLPPAPLPPPLPARLAPLSGRPGARRRGRLWLLAGAFLMGAALWGGWGALLLPALIGLGPWLLPRLAGLLGALLRILAAAALAAAAGFLLFRGALWIAPLARELPPRLAGAWEGLRQALPAPAGSPGIPRLPAPIACVKGDQGLRASPGGAIRSRVAHGTPVRILEEGQGWSRVRTPGGAVGHLPAKALERAPRTDRPLTCVRATERLRLREGPGTGYRILERLKPATPLEVLNREGEWVRVRTREGRTGFVAARWVFWPPLDPAADP